MSNHNRTIEYLKKMYKHHDLEHFNYLMQYQTLSDQLKAIEQATISAASLMEEHEKEKQKYAYMLKEHGIESHEI